MEADMGEGARAASGDGSPDPRELRDLVEKQRMQEALLRYCRGTDRVVGELMLQLFRPGATTRHGAFEGRIEDFVADSVVRIKESATSVTHALANVLVEIAPDGATATSESYFTCYLGRTVDGSDLVDVMGGRYLDRWERVDGALLVADRVVVHDWSTVVDQGEHRFPRATDRFVAGGWGPDDPVFER
jgi:hypothetical protein